MSEYVNTILAFKPSDLAESPRNPTHFSSSVSFHLSPSIYTCLSQGFYCWEEVLFQIRILRSYSTAKGTQDRKSNKEEPRGRSWCLDHGGVLFTDLLTGQSGGDIFSTEIVFSKRSLAFVWLTLDQPAQQGRRWEPIREQVCP